MSHEPIDEDDDTVISVEFDAALDGVLVAVHDVLADREVENRPARPARADVGVLSALVGKVGALVAESAAYEEDLTVGSWSRFEPAWLSFRDALIELAASALEIAAAQSIPRAPGIDEREAARQALLSFAYSELKEEWIHVGPSPAARPVEWLAALTETTALLARRVVEIDAAIRGEPHAVESVRERARDRPDEDVHPLSWVAAAVGVESMSLASLAIYAATAISSDPATLPTTWSNAIPVRQQAAGRPTNPSAAATRALGRVAEEYLTAAASLTDASLALWASADTNDRTTKAEDFDVDAALQEAGRSLERAASSQLRAAELITKNELAGLVSKVLAPGDQVRALEFDAAYLTHEAARVRSHANDRRNEGDDQNEACALPAARGPYAIEDEVLPDGILFESKDIFDDKGDDEGTGLASLRKTASAFRGEIQKYTDAALAILDAVRALDPYRAR